MSKRSLTDAGTSKLVRQVQEEEQAQNEAPALVGQGPRQAAAEKLPTDADGYCPPAQYHGARQRCRRTAHLGDGFGQRPAVARREDGCEENTLRHQGRCF